MRLSTVIELLLIFLLVAFAAYGRVIERDELHHRMIRAANTSRQSNIGLSTMSLKQATDSVNKYCTCNENICNCCRDFHIPLVQLKGPGCASLQYLQEDNLAVQLSFGDNILTSTIVNGKSPKPVCVPLPGGFTKFCGRIYSIQREAKNHFKACLGLELQSSTELEASLRVSCFRFGPEGLKLRPAEPLPVVEAEVEAPEDDDDDDFFGLGSDDDDDDDDDEDEEEDTPEANSVSDPTISEDAEEEEDDDDEDVLGLGALFDIITGADEQATKKPKPASTTPGPLLQFTIPLLTRPTTTSALDFLEVSTPVNSELLEANFEEVSEEPQITGEAAIEESNDDQETEVVEHVTEGIEDEQAAEGSNKIAYFTKPGKTPNNKVKGTTPTKRKPSITSSSANAIETVSKKKKKPAIKPIKDEEDDDDILNDDDLDDDDEDEEILEDDEEEEEEEDDEDKDDDGEDDEKGEEDENESHEEDEDEDEKAEELEDLDDDDDEEEDAVISALVYDEKDEGKKGTDEKNQSENTDDDDSDYGLGLSGLLARRSARNGRRSKVTRL